MKTWMACILILLVFFLSKCSNKIQSAFLSADQVFIHTQSEKTLAPSSVCNDPLEYVPDLKYPDHTFPLPVKINVHFMDIGDGVHNLKKELAREFAKEAIAKCNARLKTNAKMLLPLNNDTPVLPVPWFFVLAPDPDVEGDDGIYFHYDTALYYYRHGKNSNRTSRDVIDKYALRRDSVINIFMMPHHPDSVGRPDYRAVGTGIMLGSGIKVSQVFTPSLSPESCVSLFNHEIGHALGLSHTWGGNDGCDDTPNHSNCWYYTEEPPCDSLVSNNMMDYNALQAALTPCQIGRVMRNVANPTSRIRKFIRADWCTYDSAKTIIIRDSIHWKAPKDLGGDVVIADGGILQLSCRVSLPQHARIIVSPFGRLILDNCLIHNSCGDQWEGIEVLSKGKQHGSVEIYGDVRFENAVHTLDLTEPDKS